MRLRLTAAFCLLALAGCTDEPRENPQVVTDPSPRCAQNERYVHDVCTELGPDDGCIKVDDACIALCDDLQTCTTTANQLRPISGWPVAPDGYCVECTVP